MNRERTLKVVLLLFGVFFVASIYPLIVFGQKEPAVAMLLSLYVTLGIFLLLAARNPSGNRSLIAFTAWSSFAHGGLMAVQVWRNIIPRRELVGVAIMAVVWVVLIVLAPAKQSSERAAGAGA